MEQVAEILSDAIERPVRYVPMPHDAYTAELVEAGLPAEVAGHLTPMPGGTGPMTIGCLLQNTMSAARMLCAVPPG